MQVQSNGKVRRNVEERAEIVRMFELSGLSKRDFCREEGIAMSSLRKWLDRAGSAASSGKRPKQQQRGQAKGPSVNFIELGNAPRDREVAELEISFPGGVSVRLQGRA